MTTYLQNLLKTLVRNTSNWILPKEKRLFFEGSFDSGDYDCYCSFQSFHSEGDFITDNELLRTNLLKHLSGGEALFSFTNTNKYDLSEDETFRLITGRFRLKEST